MNHPIREKKDELLQSFIHALPRTLLGCVARKRQVNEKPFQQIWKIIRKSIRV